MNFVMIIIVLLLKTCEDAGRMIHSNNIIGTHAVLYWRGSDDIIIVYYCKYRLLAIIDLNLILCSVEQWHL